MTTNQTLLAFRGVYTALVTPMSGDDILWDALDELVENQIKAGINGLVPVGTTGESPTLSTEEHLAVIEHVVRAAAGRVPVIAGTGANATSEALHLTKEAEKLGVDAVLQVAPYYNKPSQEGLFQHFSKIAESTHLPIVLYSIPGRCGIDIGVDTVARLASKYPNMRTIKEAGGDVLRVRQLRHACGADLTILSGDDGLILPFVSEGAAGVISVASNLHPTAICDITTAALNDSWIEARALESRWLSLLTDVVFIDGNPVSIKTAMHLCGQLPSADVRLPLVPMSSSNRERLRAHLQQLQLLSA